MGWLTYYRAPGETDAEHFQREVLGDRYRILESATKDNVFYAAVETLDGGEATGYTRTGGVWAFVALISRTRGEFNFGYKDMDESMGPFSYDCPDRVLDLLTPVEELYGPVPEYDVYSSATNAIQWRSRCRILNARRAARPRVTRGDTVRTAEFTFADGIRADTFKLLDGRRNRWRRLRDGATVRLPRKDRWGDYEVVTP